MRSLANRVLVGSFFTSLTYLSFFLQRIFCPPNVAAGYALLVYLQP